jgi:hypothetical protein
MLDFLHKIKRIEFLLDVSCKMADNFVFQRERRKALLQSAALPDLRRDPLPWDAEIKEVIVKALTDAKATAVRLGMQGVQLDSVKISLDLHSKLDLCIDSDEIVENEEVDENVFDEDDIPLDILAAFPQNESYAINLTGPENSTSCSDSYLPPTSKYVKVFSTNGDVTLMLKSTLCWVLRSEGPKLSSDRCQRFREKVLKSFRKPTHDSVTEISHSKSISVGDFVLFGFPRKTSMRIGQVLCFKYLTGKSSFSLNSAPTTAQQWGHEG